MYDMKNLRKRSINQTKIIKTSSSRGEDCTICLENEYDEPGKATFNCGVGLACGHHFHIKCILGLKNKWICPNCRKPINAMHFFENLKFLNYAYTSNQFNTKQEIEEKQYDMPDTKVLTQSMNFAYAAGLSEAKYTIPPVQTEANVSFTLHETTPKHSLLKIIAFFLFSICLFFFLCCVNILARQAMDKLLL